MAIIAAVAFRTSVSRLIGVSFHEVKEREREREIERERGRDKETNTEREMKTEKDR
jgi:hypothetical protein